MPHEDYISGITPPDYSMFDSWDEATWKQSMNKIPFWDVLGLDPVITKNTVTEVFKALRSAGDKVFGFFHTIIEHAGTEFPKLQLQPSPYPDTTLLRAFIDLLRIHQDQLNGISNKHLEFYYRDILKQTKKLAVADTAFICAELAKPQAFELPAGTAFDAGVDAQKNPVLFATTEAVNLNPAAIANAYTLARRVDAHKQSSLYFQKIAAPGLIHKNDDGTVLEWETFGGNASPAESAIKLGIAFASPLLMLREGYREIRITLTFREKMETAMLEKAHCFLSTQTAWLPVHVKVHSAESPSSATNKVLLKIHLEPAAPPIEKFLKDPDGMSSAWPMFKMEFASFYSMDAPPVITGLKIDVKVSDLKALQLYNDNGLLDSKTPFQPFGPIPLKGNSFIVGSNEIFSKPFDSLGVFLHWDTLPDNFLYYYYQYNKYLVDNRPVIVPEERKPSLCQRIKNTLKRWFSRKKKTPGIPNPYPLPEPGVRFDNFAFTLDFALLEEQSWKNFTLRNEMKKSVACEIPDYVDPGRMLFSTNPLTCQLRDKSVFSYPAAPLPALPPVKRNVDPSIQNTPLVFTDTSTAGFMKLTLSNPRYGFGFDLYPDLVAEIAMHNAAVLVKLKHDEDPKFARPALLPFAPKLISISANYSATQEYDLNSNTNTYPLQCFFYSPFENYSIYDNAAGQAGTGPAPGTTLTGMPRPTGGLPLYPGLEYTGVLFLELDNLVPADAMNIYFELSRKAGASPEDSKIHYHYLSTDGWKELDVLADGTNNLSCPGAITVNVPTDITSDSLVMPEKKYWFSIAVTNDPGAYAKTVFLKTNGFAVQRSGITFLASTDAPKLSAGVITKTKLPVPQIATVVQPFPSFGGKPAETEQTMNQRVSQRIKTKDRAVSSSDYFSMIREEFPDIYYSKAVYIKTTKQTEIYVVRSVESASDAGAFLPLVSECMEGKIQRFLKDRASVFARIRVSNFKMEYVKVKATVTIAAGYEQEGVRKNIIEAINTFLSPWIAGYGQKVQIDQGISDAELATVINSVDGVVVVQQISLQTYVNEPGANPQSTVKDVPSGLIVKPKEPSRLFVPYSTHDIQFDPAV